MRAGGSRWSRFADVVSTQHDAVQCVQDAVQQGSLDDAMGRLVDVLLRTPH